MGIKYHYDLIQQTDEWREARCGLLSASEMDLIITPAQLKTANNDKSRTHLNELAAQRINNYVEPTWFGGDLERGVMDEIEARNLYAKNYSPVKQCGGITNDKWGFKLWYSPDGLVEEDLVFSQGPGQIEGKSRCQKYQFGTILDNEMPVDFMLQVQTGLMISERAWCDFTSYCGGMPMLTKRVYPDPVIHKAVETVAFEFHLKLSERLKKYQERLADKDVRLIPTERRKAEEISV